MENQQSDFVRARATFQDKTKQGDDQITLILGAADVEQLIEKLTNTPATEGLRLQVYLKPYNGKTLGSIKISDGSRKGGAGASQGGGTAAPVKTAFKPKSFAFKPKK